MANRHPKETELFADLEASKVTLSTEMWAYIYSVISEYLTSTRLIFEYYKELDEPVPRVDLLKARDYVVKMIEHFKKIHYPEHLDSKDLKLVKIIQESKALHPAVKELMGHYFGNDLNFINLAINDVLDSDIQGGMTKEYSERVLLSLTSITDFLEKLRYATINIETVVDKIRNKLQFPLTYLSHLDAHKNTAVIDQDKLTRCCDNLKEIKDLLDKCK
ncbi:MAG: hypothetical protein HQL25_03450 [Candidatus Omnitrophica bacterium]|nr:hypothetical protein [Candidatus Omnitrophota bacterium]